MENKTLYVNDYMINLDIDKLSGGWYASVIIYDQNDGKEEMALRFRKPVWYKKFPDGWGVTKAEAKKGMTALKKEAIMRIKHNDFVGTFMKYI